MFMYDPLIYPLYSAGDDNGALDALRGRGSAIVTD